jgi:predicted NBD/HSP70 family sugar kinase
MRRGLEGELLRALVDGGPQTRNELARSLDVPRTTLSVSLRSLAAAGHVEEGTLAASSGGRRSLLVRISPRRRVLVVSIGERRARVVVLDGHLTIANSLSVDLRDRDADVALLAGTVLRAARQLMGDDVPTAIGTATLDVESPLHLQITEQTAEAYPDTPRATVAAVRAMALGERRAGVARGTDDLVAIRLGDTVTSTTISGGHLDHGASGRAGEIGHLRVEEFGPACTCGLTGCLDSFVSARALVEQATDLTRRGRSPAMGSVLERTGTLVLDDLVAAGRSGDPVVAQLARDLGQRLGRVVAAQVAQSDPRVVVVGGPVAALGRQLLGELRATVYRLAPARVAEDLDIVLSELGEQGVAVGAASAAVDAWTVQPMAG